MKRTKKNQFYSESKYRLKLPFLEPRGADQLETTASQKMDPTISGSIELSHNLLPVHAAQQCLLFCERDTGHQTQMQETGVGKTIALQHCLASIKGHDMFDCSTVVFNCGEGFLFVVNGEGSDTHVSLPWNHCLLQIQRSSLLSKQLAISLHII